MTNKNLDQWIVFIEDKYILPVVRGFTILSYILILVIFPILIFGVGNYAVTTIGFVVASYWIGKLIGKNTGVRTWQKKN